MLGTTIDGRYRIDRLLGSGGMGAVYEAEHLGTGRRVAVKMLLRGEIANDPMMLGRFQREARAAGAIDTQHITQVFDTGIDPAGDVPYLVMEYLDGEDVQRLLRRLGPIHPDLALRIVAQACLGLQKAHDANIIHRDIKPANLFLARRDAGERVVKILDFGIAKRTDQADNVEDAGLTGTGTVLGSPLYMSPEQAQGKKDLDQRADIWSLGVVLYQALTGRTPHQHVNGFGALIVAICGKPSPPVQEFAPWVSPELAAVVHSALQIEPDQRVPSAAAMFEAIRPLLPQGHRITEDLLVPLDAAPTTKAARSPAGSEDKLAEGAVPPAAHGADQGAPAAPENQAERVKSTLPSMRPSMPMRPSMQMLRSRFRGWRAVVALLLAAGAGAGLYAAVSRFSHAPPPAAAEASSPALAGPSAAALTPTSATPLVLDGARLAGMSALVPLAERYPNDLSVQRALMLAALNDKADYPKALSSARRLYEISPETMADDVRRVFVRIINGPPDIALLALDALATSMGSFGPDTLYEVVIDQGMGKFPRDYAAKLLDKPEVRKNATTPLLITLDLRVTIPCGRKALFARAREEGDGRALPYLKVLLPTKGCTKRRVKVDCYECLGSRVDLKKAVDAIEARLNKR